ncbi:MAG: zinc ribbon domain-containing protein [Gemmatimonadota bacterium]|jgi:hypothetical protein
MQTDHTELLTRFDRRLQDQFILRHADEKHLALTVADIYYDLVPFETSQKELGVESVFDYERALLLLLAREGGCLEIESLADRQKLQQKVNQWSPDPGLLRDFLSVGVRVRPSPRQEKPEIPVDAAPAKDETMELDRDPAVGEPREMNKTVDVDPSLEVAAEKADLPHFQECPSCVEPLPQRAGVNFCPFCGEDVRRNICGACDQKLKLSWRYCIACGTEVESASPFGPH